MCALSNAAATSPEQPLSTPPEAWQPEEQNFTFAFILIKCRESHMASGYPTG